MTAMEPGESPGTGRRRLAVGGAIAALLVVLVLALALFLFRSDDDPADDTTGAGSGRPPAAGASTSSTSAANSAGTGGSGNGSRPGSGPGGTAPGNTGPGGSARATVPNATTPRPGSSRTQPDGGSQSSEDAAAKAYIAAYNARCREIWSHAGADGELWDAVDDFYGPYTIDDCMSGFNPGWEFGFDSVADAEAAGFEDATWIVENLTPNMRLKNADGFIYDLE